MEIFKSPEEVEVLTRNSQRVLLLYENDVFDVSKFIYDHPGSLKKFFNLIIYQSLFIIKILYIYIIDKIY